MSMQLVLKNTAYAYQLAGDDLVKKIEDGSIPPEKAEKMLNGEICTKRYKR